jgi:F-type H+-transporting ATPase subunit gamma
MAVDIKSVRTRIKSVDSTLHLTQAMGMVASSKMRRATAAMMSGRKYAEDLEAIMAGLAGCSDCRTSPYLNERKGEVVRLIVVAGDRGMAGGYNANVFRMVKNFENAQIVTIGKRACTKYGCDVNSSEYFTADEAFTLAQSLCEDYRHGKFDKLIIVASKYISVMSQDVYTKQILPVKIEGKDGGELSNGVVFEPDPMTILNNVMTLYVAGSIICAVKEGFACEVAARKTAMDSAGKNASEMLDDLQLQYNRARQGAITQEITEIVAGS